MKSIASFLTAFCICCISLGGLYTLCPKGKFAKAVKYVFCLCFMCCIISCFSGIANINFSIKSSSYDEILSAGAAAESARMVFERALENSNIKFSKITVLTDKDEIGSIFISKVTVYSDEDAEKIKNIISGNGSYEVEVINERTD